MCHVWDSFTMAKDWSTTGHGSTRENLGNLSALRETGETPRNGRILRFKSNHRHEIDRDATVTVSHVLTSNRHTPANACCPSRRAARKNRLTTICTSVHYTSLVRQ